MKQRESVNLKESAKSAQQEPTDHHQIQHSPSCNRQYRAQVGLNSYQRTQHSRMNALYSEFKDDLSQY